jgi:hypothetical protein
MNRYSTLLDVLKEVREEMPVKATMTTEMFVMMMEIIVHKMKRKEDEEMRRQMQLELLAQKEEERIYNDALGS